MDLLTILIVTTAINQTIIPLSYGNETVYVFNFTPEMLEDPWIQVIDELSADELNATPPEDFTDKYLWVADLKASVYELLGMHVSALRVRVRQLKRCVSWSRGLSARINRKARRCARVFYGWRPRCRVRLLPRPPWCRDDIRGARRSRNILFRNWRSINTDVIRFNAMIDYCNSQARKAYRLCYAHLRMGNWWGYVYCVRGLNNVMRMVRGNCYRINTRKLDSCSIYLRSCCERVNSICFCRPAGWWCPSYYFTSPACYRIRTFSVE